MNTAQRKLLCSTAIRALIRAEGIETIFNNIYKTGTRTLKLYRGEMVRCDVDIPRLKDRIIDLADAFNFDVKFRTTEATLYGRGGAFIVKI